MDYTDQRSKPFHLRFMKISSDLTRAVQVSCGLASLFFFFNCVRQSRFFFSLWGLGFSLFLPSIRNRWQRPRAPTHWRPPKHVTRPRSIEVNNMWKHWSSLCPLSIPFNHLSKVNIQSWLVRQQAFGAQWKNQEEMGDDGEEMTQRDRVLSFAGFGGRGEGGLCHTWFSFLRFGHHQLPLISRTVGLVSRKWSRRLITNLPPAGLQRCWKWKKLKKLKKRHSWAFLVFFPSRRKVFWFHGQKKNNLRLRIACQIHRTPTHSPTSYWSNDERTDISCRSLNILPRRN